MAVGGVLVLARAARRADPQKTDCRTGAEQIRLCKVDSRWRSGEVGCAECRRGLAFTGPERSGAPWASRWTPGAARAGLRELQRGPRDAFGVFGGATQQVSSSRFHFQGSGFGFQVPVCCVGRFAASVAARLRRPDVWFPERERAWRAPRVYCDDDLFFSYTTARFGIWSTSTRAAA